MTTFHAARLQSLPVHFLLNTRRIKTMKDSGIDVIHLDIGSPDLPPPQIAVDTLAESASNPHNHGYQPHNFSPAYRAAWADFYRRSFQVTLDPEREIVPLIGSKEGIFHLMLAVINAGDRVLVPDPGYITYTRGVQLAGGRPVPLPLAPTNGYLPALTELHSRDLKNVRILWLNYPNNPTSAAATLEFFQQAVDFAHQHQILICHDAAYTQICYDGYRAPSILQVPGAFEVAVEFNTMSKSHAMAGWRAGVLAGKPEVLSALYTLKTNADSGHFYPIIAAATEALKIDLDWISGRNESYRERRDILLQTFDRLGWEVFRSPAGMYVWVKIPSYAQSAAEFAVQILEKTHVSVTPGTVFGEQDRYLRLSLTCPTQRLQAAAGRLVEWIENEY